MQAGSAVQDELIEFISASRRDDLAKLLRYAGELLPPGGGGDGVAAHRSVLMGYLTRAPGHLVLALRAMRRIAGASPSANHSAEYQRPSTIYGGAATPTSCNSPYLATTPSDPSNSNLYKE